MNHERMWGELKKEIIDWYWFCQEKSLDESSEAYESVLNKMTELEQKSIK